MTLAPAPHRSDQVAAPRGLRTAARARPRLRAVPPAPVLALGGTLGQRLAGWGVGALGLVTGAVIGLFWYPTAALLAMLAAALISWSERR